MPKLVLARHSVSNHNASQPAADWELTPEGIARCLPLARHLAPYQPRRLFSSPMPRALQTAKAVARELEDIPIVPIPGLAEHSRIQNAPYGSASDFLERMQRFFAQPDQLVYGDESAHECRDRFARGVASALETAAPGQNTVIVAHGTVISLFAARYNAIDALALWRRLKMPAIIVLDLPSLRLHRLIDDAGRD